MQSSTTLQRQWQIIRILCARRYGATLQELSEETGVDIRTIRRDLNTFREVGFPLEFTEHDHGKRTWRIRSDTGKPNLTFTYEEAIALYLCRRFMDPLAGTHIWRAAREAFAKIRALFDEVSLEYIEKMAPKVYFPTVGASDYSQKADLLDDLSFAIDDRRQTIIVYQSQRATEPVVYAVYPLGLVYYKGSLYLVANSLDHGEIRHFKIDRLTEVDISPVHFEFPDFNLADHMANSFGVFSGHGQTEVLIRFLPPVVRYVEESPSWHHSQVLTRQPDGSLLARFELGSLEEIKSWIHSFGPHAVVLAPEQLRQQILSDLSTLQALYAQNPSHPRSREGK